MYKRAHVHIHTRYDYEVSMFSPVARRVALTPRTIHDSQKHDYEFGIVPRHILMKKQKQKKNIKHFDRRKSHLKSMQELECTLRFSVWKSRVQ